MLEFQEFLKIYLMNNLQLYGHPAIYNICLEHYCNVRIIIKVSQNTWIDKTETVKN